MLCLDPDDERISTTRHFRVSNGVHPCGFGGVYGKDRMIYLRKAQLFERQFVLPCRNRQEPDFSRFISLRLV